MHAFEYVRMYFLDHREGEMDFKQKTRPSYSDGACLAVTLGMSHAVADIERDNTETRRGALPHALLSSLFGTVLIAVAVDLVTDLGQG